MPEDIYYIRALDAKRTSVSKFTDGTYSGVYTIENSQCDCPGCVYHKTQCKHLKIKKLWDTLGREPYSFQVSKGGKVTATKLEVF